MKPFAFGLALAGLLVFVQGASAVTPAPSPTPTASPSPAPSVSGAPSPSVSGTPRQTSDPAENPEVCILTETGKTPRCLLETEGVADCSQVPECKLLLDKGSGTCERKTKETCETLSASTLPSPSKAPFVQPKDLGELAVSLYRWSLRIIGLAVLIVFFVGLFMQLTAAGLPVQVGQAKSLMTNAAMGAALLLAAYVILNTINPDFVRQSGSLPALPSPELVGTPAPTPILPAN